METLLLVARHGQTDWNRERRWQGHADRPLTSVGRAQADVLAERLADVRLDAVYASDLRRAQDTARAVAACHGLEVETVPALREVDTGEWTGLTRPEVEARAPEAFARWREGESPWRGGESYEEMADRVEAAALAIGGAHDGGRVLVVTHAGAIRALHARALGLDVPAYRRLRPVEPNARLSAVCVESGRLDRLCRTHELRGLLEPDELEREPVIPTEPSPAA